MNIQEKLDLLKKADLLYYSTGEFLISDDEYDSLKDSLLEIPNSNPDYNLIQEYLSHIGAEVVTEWEKATHKIQMNSLNKVKSIEEFTDWIRRTAKTAPTCKLSTIVVQEKNDGLSLDIEYENSYPVKGITRGEGDDGENILVNVKKMKGFIPQIPGFTGSLRCEGIIFKEDWPFVFNWYKENEDKTPANPRNAASGICRRYDGKCCQWITLKYYDIVGSNINFTTETERQNYISNLLGSDKICTTPTWTLTSLNQLRRLYTDYIENKREKLSYNIDGLVIKFDDLQSQEYLGFSGGRPKGQIALKFPPKVVVTTFLGITASLSRTGRVNPIANLKPVQLDGSTVKAASLHNIIEMQKLDLTIGCEVAIQKAGDIIPQIIKKVHTPEDSFLKPIMPEFCPDCGTKLSFDGTFLWCKNLTCPTQSLERIIHYVKTIGIEGIAESFITSLFERELVKKIPDLYKIKPEDLKGIPGIGELLIKRYFSELEKTKTMRLSKFLSSFGLQNLSVFSSEALEENYSDLHSILAISDSEELIRIEGIGDILANQLIDGLQQFKNLILETYNYVIIEEKKKGGSLEGLRICMTGSFKAGSREKIYKPKILEQGGKWVTAISKDTSYLVSNDTESNSGKTKKAKELGIPIISEDEFVKLLG